MRGDRGKKSKNVRQKKRCVCVRKRLSKKEGRAVVRGVHQERPPSPEFSKFQNPTSKLASLPRTFLLPPPASRSCFESAAAIVAAARRGSGGETEQQADEVGVSSRDEGALATAR